MKVEVSIDAGTSESRELYERIQRAIGLTERLNRIPYDQREAIRDTWMELTGAAVDEAFHLIPPLYSPRTLVAGVPAQVLREIGADGDDSGSPV